MQDIPNISMNIKIGEDVFDRNITEDLTLSQENLDESLEKQASLYAYYSLRMHQATALRDFAEYTFEKETNKAINVARETLFGSGTKVTDKQIMAVVGNDPAVLAAKEMYLKYSTYRDQLSGFVRAIEHKKDATIALAYRRRSEIDALTHNTIYSKIPKTGIED